MRTLDLIFNEENTKEITEKLETLRGSEFRIKKYKGAFATLESTNIKGYIDLLTKRKFMRLTVDFEKWIEIPLEYIITIYKLN